MKPSKTKKYTFSRIPVRGLSLQQRLPLLICILLLCTLLVFSISSYITVRKSYLEAGRERLRSLSGQLGTMFGQTFQNFLQTARQAANQEDIRAYLVTQDMSDRSSALQQLQLLNKDTTNMAVTLFNAQKKPLISVLRDSLKETIPKDLSLLDRNIPDAGLIGNLHANNGRLYYPVVHAVREGRDVVGYVLRWRKLSTSQQSVDQFSKLLGQGAVLYVANRDGTVWTDLISPITPPKDLVNKTNGLFDFEGKTGAAIGAIQDIQYTPWILTVEFARADLLEAPNRFLRWLAIAGMLFTAIGSFIAWIMSRNLTRPLKDLTAASSALASGDYNAIVPVERRDEMGKLARAFNAMSGKIRLAHDSLAKQVTETGQMNEQLRDLSAHLQNVREEERMHIAREMHDELGQLLTAFKMDVISVKRKLGNNIDQAILKKLDAMEVSSDEAIKFVRKLSAELRPSLLDDLGLIAALEWHSHEFENRYNIRVIFQSEMADISIPPSIATGIFRIFQESLTNIARHAKAHQVRASLKIAEGVLKLEIVDDGNGFDTTAKRKTLGLLGMKERAIMIGGELDVRSTTGRGTSVTISVPVTHFS